MPADPRSVDCEPHRPSRRLCLIDNQTQSAGGAKTLSSEGFSPLPGAAPMILLTVDSAMEPALQGEERRMIARLLVGQILAP